MWWLTCCANWLNPTNLSLKELKKLSNKQQLLTKLLLQEGYLICRNHWGPAVLHSRISNTHGLTTAVQHDGVVPNLKNLRRLPNISQAVTGALTVYEDQAKSTLLGKQRRSCRYNTTDIAHNPPEIRWPNEGYHSSAGKKGIPYDELSMARWVTGKLTNVYSMKDLLTAKHALLQVILAINDATSLPWGAVRSEWATSMHDLEEDNLHWEDATQWAINHLSASQMSIAISQFTQQHKPKKIANFKMKGLAPRG